DDQIWIGVNLQPWVWWNVSYLFAKDYDEKIPLKYKFDRTALTSYESNIRLSDYGITFGINIDTGDRMIGRIEQILGYLGYKGFILKITYGNLEGTAKWDGILASGMTSSFDYKLKIKHYDLIYYPNDFGYFGFGHTALTIPVRVKFLDEALITSGTPIYDKEYQISLYSIILGLDSLSSAIRGVDNELTKPDMGLTPWLSYIARFGLGKGTLSDEALQWAMSLNPGKKIVGQKSTVSYMGADLAYGLAYFFTETSALAIGYSGNLALLQKWGGHASDSSELGYDTSFILLNHGPIVRFYLLF
ncbi:MAG: hypothetical protein N3F66_05085, partial [Spirochaetes bacterium]|nr:hypothetical protein [Spirochaetota bacterium]